MDPFPPTPQQQAVITHRQGNLLVFAGPGTGKTETLARRFAALVAEGVAPDRIVVLTFSRRAADEMRDRILLRLRQLRGKGLAITELFVRTFHGFCGRLLDRDEVRGGSKELLTPVKERLLWHAVMDGQGVDLSTLEPNVRESPRFATECLNMIAHLKGQGIDAPRLAQLAGGDRRIRDIAAIFTAMEAQRERRTLRDFRDLVNEAVAALRAPGSPAVAWLRRRAFAHVLVDEFQDSDPMQLRLLEAMRDLSSPSPLFCFVGDVNQSIYRFRGASPANVREAREAFDCQILPLRDNRRSAQAILDVANADTELDPDSLTQAADAAKPGIVRLLRPRTTDDEIRAIRDAVAEKVEAGVAARAIAVLLRSAHPYQELVADALTEAGIPVASLPAAGFHEDALVDAVLTSLRLLATPQDEALWARLLRNPIVGYRSIDVRAAFDAGHRAKMDECTQMLRASPPGGLRPMREFLSSWKRCAGAFGKATPVELVQTIVRELDLLRPVREAARVHGYDPIASPLRLQALLEAAEDYSPDGERGMAPSTPVFIERLDETVGLLADASQPPPTATDGVRVMSIHAAKGLEFDVVIVPELVDGRLPASPRHDGLLPESSRRALARANVSVGLDDEQAKREEHSLWYVALTRARLEVLATAAQVDDEGVDLPLSPFAAAILKQTPASTLHSEQLTLELDAAAIGARGGRNGDGEQHSAHIIPKPPALPVRLTLETVSPSGIGEFLRCPRRFFYAKVVRLDESDEDATRFGNLLHRVLKRFHETETDFTDLGDEALARTRLLGALREIAADETRAHAPGGLTALARFEQDSLENAFNKYVDHVIAQAHSEPFTVVACERTVTSPLGDTLLRGTVDRIDRLARGGLAIRDYKSGRFRAALATAVRKALERVDAGDDLFGDPPTGLNLQTLLYLSGVERALGERVVLLEYLYFRGKNADEPDLIGDRTAIVPEGGDQHELSDAHVRRVERGIARRVVEMCVSGELARFPTAHDENACRFCDFVRICPGPGVPA